MRTTLNCGKGGVGKTFVSCGLAVYYASLGRKTAITDYDGGHSVQQTLFLGEPLPSNQICDAAGIENLSLVVIDNSDYIDLGTIKERRGNFDGFMAQFPDQLGLMPWATLPHDFWGIPTDPSSLQRFLRLVMLLTRLQHRGYEEVIIDVEPTEGLRRMLQSAPVIARGLANLRNQGPLILLALGAKWPDIKAYLGTDYVLLDSAGHMEEMSAAIELIRGAQYNLIAVPEIGPVEQTFQVRGIIEGCGGTVHSCVVNRVEGRAPEAEALARLADHRLPIAQVRRSDQLYGSSTDRRSLLRAVGEGITSQLLQAV